MFTSISLTAFATSVLAVAASAGYVATILRRRNDPTARPLIGIGVTLLFGAALHLAVVDLEPVRHALGIQWGPMESRGGFWMLIAFDIPAIVSVFWFLFALKYTGRDRRTTPVAFSVVTVLLLLLVGPNVALAAIGAVVGIQTSTLNAVLGMTIVLAESLAAIGVFLVLTTTLKHKAFPAAQTVLLTAAVGVVLLTPFAATTLQNPVITPVAILTSAVLFTVVVRRARLFETLPVASVVGRDRVIEEMQEGVIVVDDTGRIRDLNPEAESIFDIDHATTVGEPLTSIDVSFPAPSQLAHTGPADIQTPDGRSVAVSADTVTDDRGRGLGHLLVCRDVTAERRREHRLAVLTQLVAGAATEQMSAVTEISSDIASGTRPATDGGDQISKLATDTATLVARVRRVERAIADREDGDSATTAVQRVVDELDTPVELTTTGTPRRVAADPGILTATLETLAAATETSAGRATLTTTYCDDHATVEITPFDATAPGSIPALALDLAQLAAEYTDWTVDTTAAEPPAAIVRLPTAPEERDRQPPEGASP